jgi:hypothetical protein
MLARAWVLLLAVALVSAASAPAQEVPAMADPAMADTLVTVPALTPVIIRLDEEISTARHRSGDRFSILVAEDVRIGEFVVIPAGSKGEGEVIHAAKPGAGGKAGELILAVRCSYAAARSSSCAIPTAPPRRPSSSSFRR